MTINNCIECVCVLQHLTSIIHLRRACTQVKVAGALTCIMYAAQGDLQTVCDKKLCASQLGLAANRSQ